MIEYRSIYAKIDIHGLSEIEAKVYLDQMIASMPKEIVEVTVSHGYRSGNVLQNFVRKKYKNKKVTRKLISSNPGETVFKLK